MKYSAQDVASIARKLRELPTVEKAKTLNKRQVVQELSAEVTALKDRGYTIDQIADALTDSGLEITTPTLKNYLHRARAAARKRPGTRAGQSKKDARVGEAKPSPRPAASFEPAPDSDDI